MEINNQTIKNKNKKEKIVTTLSPLRYQMNKVIAVGHTNSPRRDMKEYKEEIGNIFLSATKQEDMSFMRPDAKDGS